MKNFLTFMFLLALNTAHAKTVCTTEPKSSWKDQKTFQQELSATYKIKVFKVTEGNCYEIYGHNKDGQRVEIYFNPVTGAMVKQK
jgi:hypothetical protein